VSNVVYLVIIVVGVLVLVLYAKNRNRWLEAVRRNRQEAPFVEQSEQLDTDRHE
jgi:hypothetical protein